MCWIMSPPPSHLHCPPAVYVCMDVQTIRPCMRWSVTDAQISDNDHDEDNDDLPGWRSGGGMFLGSGGSQPGGGALLPEGVCPAVCARLLAWVFCLVPVM